MELWHDCKNGTGWFALLVGDEVFMMAYSHIKVMNTVNFKSTLTLSDIVEKGMTLRKWVEMCH